ncbi:hypothetical protein D3C76_1045150 [compost metagenome]
MFESAEWRFRFVGEGVHQHTARFDLLRDDSRTLTAKDQRAQAVIRVVGNGDRFVLITIGDDRQNRAKNLVAGDSHLVIHVGKQRRANKPASLCSVRSSFATRQQPCALLSAFADIALHAKPLLFADHRPHFRCRVARVARFHRRHRLGERRFAFGFTRLRHQNTRSGDARLPAVH